MTKLPIELQEILNAATTTPLSKGVAIDVWPWPEKRADRARVMAAALRWVSTEMEERLPYIVYGHVENAIAALDAEATK